MDAKNEINSGNLNSLSANPKFQKGKELILEAMRECTETIVCPGDSDSDLDSAYESKLKKIGDLRGGPLYYPYLSSGLGRGPLVRLANGSVKLDFICGIGVHYFGHNHPAINSAAINAAMQDTVMQGNLQQSAESAEFMERLLRYSCSQGASLKHCFITTSGAMANENAIKIAFNKNKGRSRILAFEHCFAGRTIALANVTDKAAYRDGLPASIPVDYIPFYDAEKPAESQAQAVSALQQILSRYPEQHAAMIFELIQGEGGGYVPGERKFFVSLLTVLKEKFIPIIFDEIQTFGRSSTPFAFQYFGLDSYADIVTVGKMTQACATLFTSDMKPGPGIISQTFTASTSAIFCGLEVLRLLDTGDSFGPSGRNMHLHRHFADGLKALSDKFPEAVQGPFGLGGMIAFTAFKGNSEKVKDFLALLFQKGLIAFSAGTHPLRIRFLPPIGVISERDIDEALRILKECLQETFQKETVQAETTVT